MKNGWKKVVIFSLIFIALETAGSIFLMMPFYSRQMVFSNIEKGNSVKTKAYFERLSESQQEKVQSYLDDFAATLCQDYVSGKRTYDETVASLDAINEIEKDGNVVDGYIANVASNEYKSVMLDIYKINMAHETNSEYEKKNQLEKISQRLDNSDREKLMIQLLNDKYRKYLNEEISIDELSGMCALVTDYSFYEAYDYAQIIASNSESVLSYRNQYADAVSKYQGESYLEVLDICNKVTVDEWDSRYLELYAAIRQEAYDAGKEYYPDQLDKLISSGQKEAAIKLMYELEEYYGEDIDISSAKNKMIDKWQQAYIDFIQEFDTENNEHGVNTLLLYDINDDDVPEMFLFDESDIDMAYIGCEVYNVSKNNCKYLGYYNVINLCDDGYLITLPSSGDAEEAYALTAYDGTSLTEGDECKKSGETYYINGQEVSDADFLSVRTGILAHASPYTLQNSKSVDINDAVEYIMLFENK